MELQQLQQQGHVKAIGTDVLDQRRIARTIEKFPERFARRVLTPQEFNTWCERQQSVSYLAKRWAAKEAISKALGTGIAKGVSFQHMIIANDSNGKPEVELTSVALAKARAQGAEKAMISLSDDGPYVLAFCVLC